MFFIFVTPTPKCYCFVSHFICFVGGGGVCLSPSWIKTRASHMLSKCSTTEPALPFNIGASFLGCLIGCLQLFLLLIYYMDLPSAREIKAETEGMERQEGSDCRKIMWGEGKDESEGEEMERGSRR